MRATARTLACCASGSVCAAATGFGGATFTALGDLPGGEFTSHAFDLSDDGQVVVGWSRANRQVSGQYRAFRWTAATGIVPIGHLGPPNPNGIARAISRDGTTIIGSCGVEFVWTERTGMVEITGDCRPLNLSGDASVMVGQCAFWPDLVAATWTEATGWVYRGALGKDPVDAFLSGVSADGTVACGQSMTVSPFVEPTRWTEPTGLLGLGDVPGGCHRGMAHHPAARRACRS